MENQENMIKLRDLLNESLVAGRSIQAEYLGAWVDCRMSDLWSCILDGLNLRVRPEAKKRLIRVDELPPICWVGLHPYCNVVLITCRYPTTVVTGMHTGSQTITGLHCEGYEWSSDCKEWHSFEVEVGEDGK